MERRFSLERRFYREEGEVVRPLDVTMVVPKEISDYLNQFGDGHDERYMDNVIRDLRMHFYWTRVYEGPSFEAGQVDKLRLVAYRISRDPTNPFLTEEEDTFVEVEPEYEPKWIETGESRGISHGKYGFTNHLTTSEFCGFDPITNFTADAYWHIA